MPHQITIKRLDEADGGGYAASFPDLPGCFGDGETPAEAVESALLALEEWLVAQSERGQPVPHSSVTTTR